ncbi:MAG TPA: TolC family protein [Vicinamibacterales bacterium]|nr:TolC family protein [Vicinamibacterales bacterium]
MKRAIVVLAVLTCLPSSSLAQSAIRLSLADAIARGFENSHRLAEARAREEGAKAAATTADLARKPIVGANASYSRTNHVTEFSFPQPNGTRLVVYPDIPDNFMSRLSFQWPIFTSGRIDALERAAIAEAQAAGADIETTRADLRLEIVRAYWAAVTAREAERVLEESSARAEKQLTDARQRFDVGLIPPNEVSSLEAQRSREQAQLIEATNIRESAIVDVRRLIGAPDGTVIELTESLEGSMGSAGSISTTGDVPVLVKQAIDARPERKALTLRMGGAEARQQAALTATKPTVSFAGGIDYANPNPRIFPRKGEWQESWDVGVSVNWNFLDFGRAKSQAAEAAAVVTATRERIAEFDSIVSADVRQRLLDVESSQAVVRAATDAVRSAAEARRVVTDRFAVGVATSTDVLVAQVALLETELIRTRALAGVRLAEARLERSLGRQP